MTPVPDREWEGLSATWRQPPAEIDAGWVRTLVDRHTRRLRVVLAVEAAITAAGLAIAVVVMVSGRTAAAVGWGAVAVIHTGLVAGFMAWNRRGTYRPLSAATADYLRTARERCLRQRLAARFLGAVVVVEGFAFTVWMIGSDPEIPRGAWRLAAAFVTGGAVVWSLWYDWSARRRLVQLARIEAALAPSHSPTC